MITQRKREENKKWARDTLSHEMSAQHCINLASTSIVLIDLHLKWSLPLYRKCNVFIVVRFELSWDYCYVAWHNCSRIEFHIVTHITLQLLFLLICEQRWDRTRKPWKLCKKIGPHLVPFEYKDQYDYIWNNQFGIKCLTIDLSG